MQLSQTATTLNDKLFPYLLLVPALGIAGLVLLYPLLNGVYLSFTDYSLIQPDWQFVGFENYIRLFSDSIYWEVLGNSILIVGSAVFIQLILGLSVALLLDRKFPGRSIFRGAVFLIWVVPQIVIALIWLLMYNSEFGIINYALKASGLIENRIYWLGKPVAAKIAIIVIYGWRGIPFFMVMLLAALQTIPKDVIDSAMVDGANAVQRFFRVRLPFIRDIILLCIVLSVVRLFQDITQLFVLTNGGPKNSTTTLGLHVYKTAFNSFETSQAAAIGVTWLILLMMLAVFYIRLVTRNSFR